MKVGELIKKLQDLGATMDDEVILFHEGYGLTDYVEVSRTSIYRRDEYHPSVERFGYSQYPNHPDSFVAVVIQ